MLHRWYEDGPFLVLNAVIALAQGYGEVAVVDAPLGAMANTADVERGVSLLICRCSACFLGCVGHRLRPFVSTKVADGARVDGQRWAAVGQLGPDVVGSGLWAKKQTVLLNACVRRKAERNNDR